MTDLVPTGELADRMTYSKALAASDLLPKQYRGNAANVLVALEYGAALGLAPMAAIQGIHVVEGKPTASAQLIGALVRNAGHRLRVVGNDSHAVATIVRSDDPDFEFTAEWTLERAKAAGLAGKNVWKQYPAAMLKARAITEVARDACPEVLSGVAYTAEELDHGQHDAPKVVNTARLIPEAPIAQPEVRDLDEPEVVDAEVVEDEDEQITEPQLKRLGAMFSTLKVTRDDRLALVNEHLADVGQSAVESSKQLTKRQASALIDWLEETYMPGDAE